MSCEQYDIEINRAVGAPAWKLVDCRHIPPDENAMRHLIYVTLEDADGSRLTGHGLDGIRVWFNWAGMKPEETPPPVVPDKPAPEPHCNIAVYPGMKTSVWVNEPGTVSDDAEGIHTGWPSDGEGNDYGHHSFSLTFRKVEAVPQPPVVVDVSPWRPAAQPGDYEAAIRELQGNVQALFREVDRLGRMLRSGESRLRQECHQ